MSKKVRINVTQRDIERGIRFTSYTCPIARAARRHPELKGCAVSPDSLAFDNSGWVWTPLPEKACEFVDSFDGGRPVKPFSFTLELPDPQP